MAEVKAVTDYANVKTMDKDAAVTAGLYEVIGANIDDPYIEALKSQVIHWDSIREVSKDLKIVYTPLHGTGNIPARRVLKELGFEHVYVVKEQELPQTEIHYRKYQRHWQESHTGYAPPLILCFHCLLQTCELKNLSYLPENPF